jgi:hypothetical protein
MPACSGLLSLQIRARFCNFLGTYYRASSLNGLGGISGDPGFLGKERSLSMASDDNEVLRKADPLNPLWLAGMAYVKLMTLISSS